MSTRYEVKTPRAQKDGKTFWHRVGTAFRDGEDVTVYLDSAPYPDAEGRVVLKLWEPRDRDEQHRASLNRGQRQTDDLDADSVPF